MNNRIISVLGAALVLGSSLGAETPAAPDLSSAIRTPVAPVAPRINGPRVYGARPGYPFSYHLPVTGRRPMTFAAEGLPAGLNLDAATGTITGSIAKPGESLVSLKASNSAGEDTASLRIIAGETICLTPPLGWNSWNCFHGNIDEKKIRGAADAMVATGLIDHGWTYINMDDRWEGGRDANGNIQSSPSFPDMKALTAYIHGKGLKVGIYSSPGPITCGGATGSYQHEDQDAATYAEWGIDYLKYDWCSYGSIAEMARPEKYRELLAPDKSDQLRSLLAESAVLNTRQYGHDPAVLPQDDSTKAAEAKSAGFAKDQVVARLREVRNGIDALVSEARKAAPAKVAGIELSIKQAPYAKMRSSLDKVNRDIVFSFCQYGMGNVWQWGAAMGGNLWRTTGDISAEWKSVESHGFNQNGLEHWAGPGHWNDPDMLEIGNGKLTPDENYTHMTLWCMLSAPLLIGCDMRTVSPFIVSLFSNDEVLAVNQDALGQQGWRAKQDGAKEVWVKPLADKTLAVAFFNRGDQAADVSVQWSDLRLNGPQTVRDLWRQRDMGVQESAYSVPVAPHSAELFKVSSRK